MKRLNISIIILSLIFLIPFSVKGEEHNWVLQTIRPTLTENGYEADICKDCNEEKDKKVIPAMRATIVRVVDGDTIVVKTTDDTEYKVRFIGVNTPESVAADSSKNTPEGITASNYTKNLLKTGSTIYLEYDESCFDIYGRVLAYPWLTDISDKEITDELFNTYNVGALLLQNTYCEAAYYKPNGKYKERYDELYKNYQPYKESKEPETTNNDVQEENKNDKEDTNKNIIDDIISKLPKNQLTEKENIWETIISLLPSPEKVKEEVNTQPIEKVIAKIKKITNIKYKKIKNKNIKITWKKADNATQYQIQVSTKKSMKKVKTYTSKKTSFVLKKLKKNKKYYIRIRGINDETYGDWSKIKSVKVKK